MAARAHVTSELLVVDAAGFHSCIEPVLSREARDLLYVMMNSAEVSNYIYTAAEHPDKVPTKEGSTRYFRRFINSH